MVTIVAPSNATIDDIIPIKGIVFPISKPITSIVPLRPNMIPTHWIIVTFSFKIGPLKIFVKTGCKPNIKAESDADKPSE